MYQIMFVRETTESKIDGLVKMYCEPALDAYKNLIINIEEYLTMIIFWCQVKKCTRSTIKIILNTLK